MQPITVHINQLTDRPSPPTGGSGVPAQFGEVVIPLALDISQLDEAQKKADKLKATLLEVQELIRQTNLTSADIEDKIITDITNAVKAATTYHTTPPSAKEVNEAMAELKEIFQEAPAPLSDLLAEEIKKFIDYYLTKHIKNIRA